LNCFSSKAPVNQTKKTKFKEEKKRKHRKNDAHHEFLSSRVEQTKDLNNVRMVQASEKKRRKKKK
jgi:hypothetical protein